MYLVPGSSAVVVQLNTAVLLLLCGRESNATFFLEPWSARQASKQAKLRQRSLAKGKHQRKKNKGSFLAANACTRGRHAMSTLNNSSEQAGKQGIEWELSSTRYLVYTKHRITVTVLLQVDAV